MTKDLTMPEETATTPEAGQDESVTMALFLTTSPPGTEALVKGAAIGRHNPRVGRAGLALVAPALQLFCHACEHTQTFVAAQPFFLSDDDGPVLAFLSYKCRNCMIDSKQYALIAEFDGRPGADRNARVRKIGEHPPFGPPMPRRLQTLVGDDWDLLLKGRRAENQGLGVGAFAYYRRVVERRQQQILAEIVKAAEQLRVSDSILSTLKAAQGERQFAKAVDMAKDAIPEALLLEGGHNPLTLLHGVLSEHLHARSDEECLEIAKSIRVVLTELAVRTGQITQERGELKEAVSKLLNP